MRTPPDCEFYIEDATDFYDEYGEYPDPDDMPYCAYNQKKCDGNCMEPE